VEIYRTAAGLARREGDELLVLDLPHPDVAALLRDDPQLTRTARVRARRPLAGTRLRSPVARPDNLLLTGLAYPAHVAEAGLPTPREPHCLPLPGRALDDPGAPILIPEGDVEVDYEGELAVVIGQQAVDVDELRAWDCIAGLTVVNDVSERAGQRRAMSSDPWDRDALAASKTHPSFKPCGPALVTIDEFDRDPDLAIRTELNGTVVQQDRTSTMIFGLGEVVAALSRRVPLGPGDVISTGTPAGVALATGRYLRPGDLVEVTVEGVGTLANPVVGPGSAAEVPA
jgi:2-keto-4-pentenoate hydratase/2-oxohepta-3-ene-1,7-dioic acid hydratase in catechol pathway